MIASEYRNEKSQKIKIEREAGVVIYRFEFSKMLFFILRKRKSGKWGLCKGRIENGEDEFSGAFREVWEETGINELSLHTEFKKTTYHIGRDEKNNLKPRTVTWFLGNVKSEKIHLSQEHSEYTWIEITDAVKKTSSTQGRVLQIATFSLTDQQKLEQIYYNKTQQFISERERSVLKMLENDMKLRMKTINLKNLGKK